MQTTAYEMRISDWSADVCSSDLCPRLCLRLDSLCGAVPVDDPLHGRRRGDGLARGAAARRLLAGHRAALPAGRRLRHPLPRLGEALPAPYAEGGNGNGRDPRGYWYSVHDRPDGGHRLLAAGDVPRLPEHRMRRSEEHTSELQSLMRISYAVFCLK